MLANASSVKLTAIRMRNVGQIALRGTNSTINVGKNRTCQGRDVEDDRTARPNIGHDTFGEPGRCENNSTFRRREANGCGCCPFGTVNQATVSADPITAAATTIEATGMNTCR